MSPEEAGPLREREQLRSSAIVGVDDVQFWDFPDSQIRNTAELRAKIAETITELAPDVVITLYSGPDWAPGAPNQRDHIEFSLAVAAAYDSLPNKPRWFFENGPHGTHGEVVDDFIDVAVESLAAHDVYLSVYDPKTPVLEQARIQVDRTTLPPLPGFEGHRAVEFILKRES
jgi:LmbE family N-acetylglucosaminyl deacetylase